MLGGYWRVRRVSRLSIGRLRFIRGTSLPGIWFVQCVRGVLCLAGKLSLVVLRSSWHVPSLAQKFEHPFARHAKLSIMMVERVARGGLCEDLIKTVDNSVADRGWGHSRAPLQTRPGSDVLGRAFLRVCPNGQVACSTRHRDYCTYAQRRTQKVQDIPVRVNRFARTGYQWRKNAMVTQYR
jgi:hypothetical protein